MRRAKLAVPFAVLASISLPNAARSADPCGVVATIQPLRDEDKAKKEVTYAGEVANRGERIARFTSVRLRVVNRTSGAVLGESSEAVKPATLAPGETARFRVTASTAGSEYLDVKTEEKLTFEATRCDALGTGEAGASGGATCGVVVGQPFDKAIDDQAHTVTFSGTVENRGGGTARGVQVTGWVIGQDKLLDKRQAPTEPRDLAPGSSGTFTVTVPLAPGQRKGSNDRVTVDVERCD